MYSQDLGDKTNKLGSLALELEFLTARLADEIRELAVVRKRFHFRVAAMGAVDPGAHPALRPGARLLRTA